VLAVAEIASSLVLLIGAALMMRTFVVVRSVKPGFDAANALTMKTSLAGAKYSTAPKMETLIRNMEEHFESLPGVQAAAYAFSLPVEGGPDMPFSIIGHAPPHGEPYQGSEQYRLVSAHYFRALGVPLRRGRLFNDADSSRGAPVVILNEAFAKKYWPKEDPLGLSISIGHGMGPEFEDRPRLIVGIVGNVRENGLDQDLPPVYYVPEEQAPDGMIARSNRMFPSTWIVRTSGSPSALAGSVEREMLRVDPQLPVSEVYSMAQIVSKSTARQNFNMLLLGIFAGVALLLAAAGIYGVMAYSVEQRTHEIGVRMALGANRREVLGLVLKRGMTLALAGLAVGMVAAFGLTRLLKSMLFGIAPHDPGTFVAVPVLLTLVSALACAIPARRAAKVDPMVALRHE
jgi:predicted permease